MTAARPPRQGSLLLASLTGILVLADVGLAAIGLLVWNAQRRGDLTAAEAATFTLLGASAAAGAVVLLLALIALVRGPRGHGIARLAAGLAWLRLAAVIVTLAVIAIRLGGAAIAGTFATFGAVVTVAEAVIVLIVTGAALRRTVSEGY